MSLYNQFRRSGLEAYASFDADNRVAHVAVAADGIRRTNLFNLLNSLYLVVELLPVHRNNLALLERNLQLSLFFFGCNVLQISLLGQSLCRVEQLAAADTRSPNAHIVGVFQLCKVGKVPVCVQIVHLLLACQVTVARQRDNLHTRSHHEERHVEPNLVVARTRRAVRDGIRAYLVGVACNGDSLKNTLRRHRDRIAVVAHHVAVYHILERLLIVFLSNVERNILHRAQLIGVLFVLLQLLFAESSGVGASRIHLISHLFGEIHYIVARVESATESYYNLFLCHIFLLFEFFLLFGDRIG